MDRIEQILGWIEKQQYPSYHEHIPPGTQAFLLGENHTDNKRKKEMRAKLEELHSLGFGALAMEAFDQSYQPMLDRYAQASAEERVRLRKTIIHDLDWRWYEIGNALAGRHFMRIVDKALRLGMRIIALDIPEEDPERENKMTALVEQNLQAGEKIAIFIGNNHLKDSPSSLAGKLAQDSVGVAARRTDEANSWANR